MKYKIVYADPPWKYRDKGKAGKRGAEQQYNVMTLDDIKALPVEDICDDDCVLFMWVTMPFLTKAQDVMEAWGFNFKTCAFSWIKTNKNAGTPFWGMGNWTRSNCELCLLGVRGKPKRVSRSVHSVIFAPIRKHSQKPDIVRDKIVELMGDLPRVELFSRSETPGWDSFGDHINGALLQDTLKEIADGYQSSDSEI